MLKYQMALMALLIGCFAFTSCDLIQEVLTPPMPEEDMMPIDDTMPTDDTMVTDDMATDDTIMPDDSTMVTDDGTTTDDGTMPDDSTTTEDMPEAYTSWLSATLPTAIGSGAAHTQNPRTIYINDVGVMALQAGETTFPAGTIVYKDIMDATNTSVAIVERMEKTDDPMYATENGWLYNEGATQAGCHGCHSTAGVDPIPGMDSVFTVQALMASLAAAGMEQ